MSTGGDPPRWGGRTPQTARLFTRGHGVRAVLAVMARSPPPSSESDSGSGNGSGSGSEDDTEDEVVHTGFITSDSDRDDGDDDRLRLRQQSPGVDASDGTPDAAPAGAPGVAPPGDSDAMVFDTTVASAAASDDTSAVVRHLLNGESKVYPDFVVDPGRAAAFLNDFN